MLANVLNKHGTWSELLKEEFNKDYMNSLHDFVKSERESGREIYPKSEEIFAALDLTPFSNVRVVIIGQDPYINENQAHGLAFSVRDGIKVPPSLRNIYKEIGIPDCPNGCLKWWANQGVLLLNNVLTVEKGRTRSHYGRGWERFTDKIIEILNNKKKYVVYMLWGNEAKKKGKKINRQNNLVLEAPHPSPLSAHKGFFGCKHFEQANAYLLITGQRPIDWYIVNRK